ncbi:hypothetical protein [Stenotrophobium rhamnosiphilum]|uniref:FecR protein domain-containing protein n=1 Tax=Stenotrophobium rhamnosiphilum TaxID=2029166 RepID=A0A2T5MK46_9GAMM|nr:hypothetical protein [Stenotrophobium rhamnosiphilum]PTU32934.1 hypothetical protein CJD38_02140 [Stenotrophobium rhamnosiphilum]
MKIANIAAAVLACGSFFGTGAVVASNDPAATGRLLTADGGVLIQRSAQTDIAIVGNILGVGDMIFTTDTGRTQWQMSDTSLFAIAPDSAFKINKYALPPKKGNGGVASYTLLKGSVHTVTGRIGKAVAANASRGVYTSSSTRFNPENLRKVAAAPSAPYTLKTSIAVITTQGADYLATQVDKVLKVLVKVGSVTVCTVGGCASPVAGEGVVVSCEGCKPAVVASANLDLDVLYTSLQFDLKNVAIVVDGDQVHDPRTEPVSPTQACRTVLSQLYDAVPCGGRGNSDPDDPVSPN